MRKTGLLNTAIIKEISAIGHTQYLIIGDAGLPIPKDTLLIDLALKSGVPSFLETAEAVLDEMVVEHYTDRRDLSVCQYCSCGRRQFLKLRR